jgi:hypothetical protein
LAFGVSVTDDLASFLTSLASSFFTSGEVPGLAGEPVGETAGLATGLAEAAGDGEAAGFGVSVFGSQAPTMAAEATRTDVNTNDLLIVLLLQRYSLLIKKRGRNTARRTDIPQPD